MVRVGHAGGWNYGGECGKRKVGRKRCVTLLLTVGRVVASAKVRVTGRRGRTNRLTETMHIQLHIELIVSTAKLLVK